MLLFKRIHSLIIAAATSLAVMGGVTSAQAAVVTFDFAQIAVDFGEQPFNNSAGYATKDGITVQVAASGNSDSTGYLDAPFNDLFGGLGVCSSGINGQQCSNSADDNVSLIPGSSTIPEMLTLTFFSDPAAAPADAIDVTINPTFFRNSIHGTTFSTDALIDIAVNGGTFTAYPLTHEFTTKLGPGHTFDFRYNNEQFYIQSLTVPLPAALPLFLSALAGLALVGRRQRKKAAG